MCQYCLVDFTSGGSRGGEGQCELKAGLVCATTGRPARARRCSEHEKLTAALRFREVEQLQRREVDLLELCIVVQPTGERERRAAEVGGKDWRVPSNEAALQR